MKLGKIDKVDLREVWPHEERDFSKWLAIKENLDLLSSEIGIELNLLEVEKSVGKYSLDILAEDVGTEKKVVIENQLEKTDHDHLGKVLTYASGVGANTIVWIARDVEEEHRQAINWLNENTGEGLNFFIVQIEAIKIGESDIAPRFNVICKPNNWTKISRSNSGGGNTETNLKKLKFWEEFKDYANKKGASQITHTPSPHHWYNVAVGSSHAHLSLTFTTNKHWIACELYINNNKDLFEFLQENREEIEQKLGVGLEWIAANKATRIAKRNNLLDPMDEKDREKCFDWYLSEIKSFDEIFRKMIKEYEKTR